LRAGTLVDLAFISNNFGTPDHYKELVMEYIKTRCLPDDVMEYLQAFEVK
jgi:hypothetical protein